MDYKDKRRLQRQARYILEVLEKNGYDVEKYKEFLPVLEARREREREYARKMAKKFYRMHSEKILAQKGSITIKIAKRYLF